MRHRWEREKGRKRDRGGREIEVEERGRRRDRGETKIERET